MFTQVKVVIYLIFVGSCIFVPGTLGRKCVRFIEQYENPHCKDMQSCQRLEECNNEDDYCFATFEYDATHSTLKPLVSGCKYYEMSTKRCDSRHNLNSSQCVLEYFIDNLFECCCVGEECNRYINLMLPHKQKLLVTTPKTATHQLISKETVLEKKLILIIPIGISLICIIAIIAFFTKNIFLKPIYEKCDKASNEPIHLLPSLQKQELVYRGPYTAVWKGKFNHKPVAIKYFTTTLPQERWKAEEAIYTEHKLKHENVLVFVGAFEIEETTGLQFVLLTEYANHGSLYDYLQSITCLNLHNVLVLMSSVINGLAYLHRNAFPKPIIAHRDLKSHNIMVMHGLNCCIGDFGFAVAFDDSYSRYIPQKAKNQVGTKRYMSPEVLQGAIPYNLEAVLFSDIYSLSLVLWEILTRCGDASNVDAYQLPYEEHVGKNPSLLQMRRCVVEKKIRPSLKDEWRKDKSLSEICVTLEECWDVDNYARLSAECLVIRIAALMNNTHQQHQQHQQHHVIVHIQDRDVDFHNGGHRRDGNSNETSSLLSDGDDDDDGKDMTASTLVESSRDDLNELIDGDV